MHETVRPSVTGPALLINCSQVLTDGNFPYYMWAASQAEVTERIRQGEVMPCPHDCPPGVYAELLTRCWALEPNDRPTCARVRERADRLIVDGGR